MFRAPLKKTTMPVFLRKLLFGIPGQVHKDAKHKIPRQNFYLWESPLSQVNFVLSDNKLFYLFGPVQKLDTFNRKHIEYPDLFLTIFVRK